MVCDVMIHHEDYEIINLNCYIENKIIYTIIEYYRDDVPCRKVFKNRIIEEDEE